MSEPVESIDAVSSSAPAQNTQQLQNVYQDMVKEKTRWQEALSTQDAAQKYSCYMLIIQVLNHLSLDKIDAQVLASSQLMDVEHQLQQNFVKMATFISQLQSQSTGSGEYTVQANSRTYSSPNSFSGLKWDYYHIENQLDNYGKDVPSDDFKKSAEGFVDAFRETFYCNTNASAPTVKDLSTISNPNVFQGGRDFDLSGFWKTTEGQYSQYERVYTADPSGSKYAQTKDFKVVSSNQNDHASLLQQYMYYQAQMASFGSVGTVDAAKGDISKLINFDPKSKDFSPFLKQVLQVINTFDVQEKANVQSPTGVTYNNPLTDKMLDLILNKQFDDYSTPGSIGGHWQLDPNQDEKAGFYGACADMGFNYFWSKNVTGGSSGTSIQVKPVDPRQPGPGNVPGAGSDWTDSTSSVKGMLGGDDLTGMSAGFNGIETNLGTVTNTESVTMQELTGNQGENVSIGQDIIKAMNQNADNVVQNQVSS